MAENTTSERALASRVQAIESSLLRALTVTSGFLVVIGLLLPVASFTSVNHYRFSVIDLCIWAFSPKDSEFQRNFGGDIGIVLATLTVLTALSALLALVSVGWGTASRAQLIWVRASSVAVTLCVLAIGWVLLTVDPSAGETREPENAAWPLLIGLGLCLVTAFAPATRAWWENRAS